MASLYVFVLLISYELALVKTASRDRNREAYQCLVCQYTIDEINEEIKKVDPRKTLEVGGYCSNLENEDKKIPYARSEVGLVEIFERVCGAFENYCRAKYKDTGSPTILKYFTSERDSLNPEMAKVDVVTDSDLNESLRYYCEQIIEEHQDELLRYFGRDDPDIKEKICMQKVCRQRITPGNYGEPLKSAGNEKSFVPGEDFVDFEFINYHLPFTKKNDGVKIEGKREIENKTDRYNKDEFKEEKPSMESNCGKRMVERPSKVVKYQ
ncbi:protein canopy homolog 2-like [Schistocerca nitens]|uniref:protein canopy homolog 2-like n=1 Tax=Schistocerca nitens TaxID=7011 RepID=UPI002117572C|nr:protein canopy homolog 2-like [Schistocerca nitens]